VPILTIAISDTKSGYFEFESKVGQKCRPNPREAVQKYPVFGQALFISSAAAPEGIHTLLFRRFTL